MEFEAGIERGVCFACIYVCLSLADLVPEEAEGSFGSPGKLQTIVSHCVGAVK